MTRSTQLKITSAILFFSTVAMAIDSANEQEESRLTRKPRLASGGFRKGFEQAHIGLCRGAPCGASSAKDNARLPKDLRKASRMQSRFSGLIEKMAGISAGAKNCWWTEPPPGVFCPREAKVFTTDGKHSNRRIGIGPIDPKTGIPECDVNDRKIKNKKIGCGKYPVVTVKDTTDCPPHST